MSGDSGAWLTRRWRRIWACGASTEDADTEPEVVLSKAVEKRLLEEIAPRAETQYLWPKPGNVELIHGEGPWAFKLVAFD